MDQATQIDQTEQLPTENYLTPVALFARCMLPNQLEIPCQAVGLSPDKVRLVSAHCPGIGDRAIVYLDHVGRVEGNTIGHFEGGFTLEIECTSRKRDKLHSQIQQLQTQDEQSTLEQRQHDRIAPKNTNSELKLSDGRCYPIKIIDISLSGAAVAIDVKPAVGSKVWLAGMQGTVIRHFTEGVAMQFAMVAEQSAVQKRFA